MKPWEKACPWTVGGVPHMRWPCDDCHGTGYVPMSTDEMLEALQARHRVVSLFCDSRQDDLWGVICWDDTEDRENPTLETERGTPDGSLRAALEATA